ncbi:hypothetical protein ES708_02378 [subsurface metagenome]
MPGALIWGWDPVNKKWVPVRVAADGKLQIKAS